MSVRPEALLVLADGTVFEGEAIGWWDPEGPAVATGEVVFNTTLTGYQEVLTDPSYAGQIVCFTYPHIGNYGVAGTDDESRRAFCRGLIVRDVPPRPSSWRSERSLADFLVDQRLPGITGIDTRRLTRHIRDAGAMPAAFGPVGSPSSPGRPGGPTTDEATLREAAASAPGTDGKDLAAEVTTPAPYTAGGGPLRVVAYDFGIKRAILTHLGRLATVEVVPAWTPAEEVLERRPDGVFLSNGPGDPSAVGYASKAIGDLLGRVPVFGICLGHQLMATALGAGTYKLPFGHHGGNHPVRRLATGSVEITSQNHNYAVAPDGVDGVDITHVNLNDGVLEGLACRDVPAFSVQYHPEAGPGPHDASYLFAEFEALMRKGA
ncbi:MAG: glutamine-hydrolyzing carbamoyl-phosphate synthase small subunit [Acidimicrobiales bacterium]